MEVFNKCRSSAGDTKAALPKKNTDREPSPSLYTQNSNKILAGGRTSASNSGNSTRNNRQPGPRPVRFYLSEAKSGCLKRFYWIDRDHRVFFFFLLLVL